MSETGLHVTGVASRDWRHHRWGEAPSDDPPGNGSSKSGQAIFPQQIQAVSSLVGKSAADIEALLLAEGFSKIVGRNGGAILTKALPDGNTAAVRIDPPKVKIPTKNHAYEVPHVHKEIVPTSRVIYGNYPSGNGVTTLYHNGIPIKNPRDTRIP